MKLLIILFFTLNLFANIKQNMFYLYKTKQYQKLCIKGFTQFPKFRKDEDTISLYAFACLKSNQIDKLAIPIITLKNSKEARANASYFSIILMQKKLLQQSLLDGYNLKNLHLPSTEHILSKVFNLYVEVSDRVQEKFYILKDKKDSDRVYKLYTSNKKIIIEEFYNSIKINHHIYN